MKKNQPKNYRNFFALYYKNSKNMLKFCIFFILFLFSYIFFYLTNNRIKIKYLLKIWRYRHISLIISSALGKIYSLQKVIPSFFSLSPRFSSPQTHCQILFFSDSGTVASLAVTDCRKGRRKGLWRRSIRMQHALEPKRI